MSIVLTCGFRHSGFEVTHELLNNNGFSDATPSISEGLSPAELNQRILKNYGIETATSTGMKQVAPGRVWQALSIDLIRANLDRINWGWADTNNIYLLDYWRDFDPAIRFNLVYSSPDYVVARLIAKERPSESALMQELQLWRDFHEEMLSFYLENKEKALLTNVETLFGDDEAYLEKCRTYFQLESVDQKISASDELRNALPRLMALHLVDNEGEVEDFYQELESVADLPLLSRQAPEVMAYDAWRGYHSLSVKPDWVASSSHVVGLSIPVEKLKQEFAEERDGYSEEIKRLNGKLEDGAKENELLLLQLQQVQEELEHYFLKYQELKDKKTQEIEKTAVVEEPECVAENRVQAIVDMRHFIDGENWYHAEDDGRWAGPNTVSTLRLPPLAMGRYRLEVDVVDAFDAKIFKALKLSFDGNPLKTRRKMLAELNGPLAPIKRALLRTKLRRSFYPSTLISNINIENNNKSKPRLLEFQFPRTVSPAEFGHHDTRELAVRVQRVLIVRQH